MDWGYPLPGPGNLANRGGGMVSSYSGQPPPSPSPLFQRAPTDAKQNFITLLLCREHHRVTFSTTNYHLLQTYPPIPETRLSKARELEGPIKFSIQETQLFLGIQLYTWFTYKRISINSSRVTLHWNKVGSDDRMHFKCLFVQELY